jgi:hypothetical protein
LNSLGTPPQLFLRGKAKAALPFDRSVRRRLSGKESSSRIMTPLHRAPMTDESDASCIRKKMDKNKSEQDNRGQSNLGNGDAADGSN